MGALLAAAMRLKDFNHDADVWFVMTAREEVAFRTPGGVINAANVIKPDIAVAVDVTNGKVSGSDEFGAFELGKGAVISVGPLIHRKLFERLKKVSADDGIPTQIAVKATNTYTDADDTQNALCGVVNGLISIPLKYMHTPNEVVQLSDISAAGRLAAGLVKSLNIEEICGVMTCC
jgi:endoglucanase